MIIAEFASNGGVHIMRFFKKINTNGGVFRMMKVKRLRNKTQYFYIAKFFRGVPVVTLKDIEFFTKIPYECYYQYILRYKQYFINEQDYWYLKEGALLEFQAENPTCLKRITKVFVMTPAGLLKLSNIIKKEQAKKILGRRGGKRKGNRKGGKSWQKVRM